MFHLAGKFKLGIKNKDFEKAVMAEIDRHYKLEPHHAQHTDTAGTINRIDILEMAVDQLARSVYRQKGKTDEEPEKRFLPQFKGDTAEEQLAWFTECYRKHVQLLITVYDEYRTEEHSCRNTD